MFEEAIPKFLPPSREDQPPEKWVGKGIFPSFEGQGPWVLSLGVVRLTPVTPPPGSGGCTGPHVTDEGPGGLPEVTQSGPFLWDSEVGPAGDLDLGSSPTSAAFGLGP